MKKILTSVALSTVIGVGAIVFSMNNNQQDNTTETSAVPPMNQVDPIQVVAEQSVQAPVVEEKPAAKVENKVVAQTPPQETKKYGQSSEGIYKVFDTKWAMLQAGIEEKDHELVKSIVKTWIYKQDGTPANLCNVVPKAKMATAGADYEDNPVTQLKWCNQYAITRYGSWSAVIDSYNERGSF